MMQVWLFSQRLYSMWNQYAESKRRWSNAANTPCNLFWWNVKCVGGVAFYNECTSVLTGLKKQVSATGQSISRETGVVVLQYSKSCSINFYLDFLFYVSSLLLCFFSILSNVKYGLDLWILSDFLGWIFSQRFHKSMARVTNKLTMYSSSLVMLYIKPQG